MIKGLIAILTILSFLSPLSVSGADKLIGIHSSRVMSQSMPWIAHEAGLFKKYDLDFQLVYLVSSGLVTAALLGGDAEMTLTGGVGNVRGYLQGATDLVFIASVKNFMTQTIVAAAPSKSPRTSRERKSPSPESAVIRTTLRSRHCGASIWSRDAILPFYKPAATLNRSSLLLAAASRSPV